MFDKKILVALIVIIILWLVASPLVKMFGGDWATTGQIGDSYGLINSLFSGLALTGVIYSLIQQKQSIDKQQEEINQTAVLTAKAILLEAYSHRINWYYIESERKVMKKDDFEEYSINIKADINEHKELINSLKNILNKKNE